MAKEGNASIELLSFAQENNIPVRFVIGSSGRRLDFAKYIDDYITDSEGAVSIHDILDNNQKMNLIDIRMLYFRSYSAQFDEDEALERIKENFSENNQKFDIDDFLTEHVIWEASLLNQVELEAEEFKERQSGQDQLNAMAEAEHSDAVIIETVVRAYIDDLPPGIKIFDIAVVSEKVPYIRLNASAPAKTINNAFKIFLNLEGDPAYIPNVESIKEMSKKTGVNFTENNYLYAIVWVGTLESHKTVKASYVPIGLDLNTGNLTFFNPISSIRGYLSKTKINPETYIQDIFTKTFGLTINGSTELRTELSSHIFDVDYDEITFLECITNDPLFSKFLGLREREKSYGDRTAIGYQFKPLERPPKLTLQKIVVNENKVIGGRNLKAREFYLSLRIRGKISVENAINYFNETLHLLTYYNKLREELIKLYSIIEGFKDYLIEQHPEQPIKRERKVGEAYKLLRQFAPEIFIVNYNRQCQKYPPVIIKLKDKAAFEATTFTDARGVSHRRRTLLYPVDPLPGQKQYIIGCAHATHPYVNLKQAKIMENRDKYPFIPCCKAEDPSISNKYKMALLGKVVEGPVTKGHITTTKVLKYDGTGELGTVLLSILDTGEVSVDGKPRVKVDRTIQRLGVVNSPSSLFHCVLTALEVDDYMYDTNKEKYVKDLKKRLAKNAEDKEEYVKDLREWLAENMDITWYSQVLRQELYDYDLETIRAEIADSTKFLDPRKYYRLLEAVYDIDIVVFVDTDIEIPRNKVFHSRVFRSNRLILINKNYGTESYTYTYAYPQCEIIHDASVDEAGLMSASHFDIGDANDTTMVNHVRDLFKFAYSPVICSDNPHVVTAWPLYNLNIGDTKGKEKARPGFQVKPESQARPGFQVKPESHALPVTQARPGFQVKPESQVLDVYGKMRGLNYPTFTILFEPNQPENLPEGVIKLTTEEQANSIISLYGTKKAYGASATSTSVFGMFFSVLPTEAPPSGVLPTEAPPSGVLLTGYIPCKPFTTDDNLPLMFPPMLASTKETEGNRVSKLKRNLKVYMEIFIWLFMVLMQDDTTISLEDIPELIMTKEPILEQPVDSLTIYDFSQLPWSLPKVNSFIDAIEHLETHAESCIKNGKLFAYSEEFYNKMVYFARPMILNKLMKDTMPSHIENHYEFTSDFIQYPNSAIFINESTMDAWLHTKVNTRVRTTITEGAINLDTPYYYSMSSKYEPGSLFMIQNTSTADSIKRALNVAITWKNERINLGWDAEPIQEIPPYHVYLTNSQGILKRSVDLSTATQDDEDAPLVMAYKSDGDSIYGAMLTI